MRYLSLAEVLDLHGRVISQTGGASGVRDLGTLEAAVAQPRMTFGESDLYGSIGEKAAALGFSLIHNHPFVDGNKRVGHAAMETFLVLNGYEFVAPVHEAEQVILAVAAGSSRREDLLAWIRVHVARIPGSG